MDDEIEEFLMGLNLHLSSYKKSGSGILLGGGFFWVAYFWGCSYLLWDAFQHLLYM